MSSSKERTKKYREKLKEDEEKYKEEKVYSSFKRQHKI